MYSLYHEPGKSKQLFYAAAPMVTGPTVEPPTDVPIIPHLESAALMSSHDALEKTVSIIDANSAVDRPPVGPLAP